MLRCGRFIIKRDGFTLMVSAPSPWDNRLKSMRRVFLAIDVLLGLVGGVAAIFGLSFGLPVVGFALTLLLLINFGTHVIVEAETTSVTAMTSEASVSVNTAMNMRMTAKWSKYV